MTLREQLDVAAAASLHAALRDLLTANGRLEVDGGAVMQVDTAVMQLLLAFVREAGWRGLSLRWVDVSDRLREAAGTLGLQGAMGWSADGLAAANNGKE